MKKYLISFISTLSLVTLSAIQSPVFGWANGEGSAYAQGNMTGSLAFSFHHLGLYGAFDYGIHDCISAGAVIGYDGYSRLDARYNHVPLMARAAFHPFNLAALADKIVIRDIVDVYAGITTGLLLIWIRRDNMTLEPVDYWEKTGFRIREYIGMRYTFADKWAFFVEDCGDVSTVAVGISYKF